MNMPISASFWTENLFPISKRISSESKQNCDGCCQWDSRDQTQRTNQRPHDLLSHEFKIDKITIIAAAKRKHEQHGQRRARVGQHQCVDSRRYMVLPNPHCRSE